MTIHSTLITVYMCSELEHFIKIKLLILVYLVDKLNFLTDEKALEIFKSLTLLPSTSDVSSLGKPERNNYVRALKAKGLTIKQIARLMDISETTVKRICKVLKVNEYDLIKILLDGVDELNVIILDDRKIVVQGSLSVVEEVLSNANIFGFTSPVEAVEFAEKKKISLIFLDIEMGKTNGLDICKKFLEINPQTNIIFLTAYIEYSFEAWSTGASGYLLKPITVENLRAQLKNLRYPLINSGEIL